MGFFTNIFVIYSFIHSLIEGCSCFTKTDLYPVYYYEMVLAWIQVVFWSSMFMYKTSGSSTSSTRPTILWVLVRGNSDYSILDVISHVCCALVSFQQIASCARRVLLQRRCSVFASYWCLRTSSTARSAWSVSCKERSGTVVTMWLVVRGKVPWSGFRCWRALLHACCMCDAFCLNTLSN